MSASSSTSRAASLRSGFGRRRSTRLIRSLIFRQSSTKSEAAIPVTSSSSPIYSPLSSSAAAHKKRPGGLCGFRRPTWFFLALLVVLLAAGHMAQAFDFFDADCPDNSMRKPPRFGKRSPPVLDLAPGSTELDQRTVPSRARRAAGSDCFRGPLRRRTLRQSPDTSLPSMLNQLNVALLRNLMRQNRLDRARRVSEEPAYVAFAPEQEEPAPPAEILLVPSSSSMRLLGQDSPQQQQQQDAKPVLDLRQFIMERAKARAKKDATLATKDSSAGSASTEM